MTKPACFDREDDYREWMAYSKASRAPVIHGFCWDCNPIFKAEMVFLGKCEYPDVTFHYTEEGVTLRDGKRGNYHVLQGFKRTSTHKRSRKYVDIKTYRELGAWYWVPKKRKQEIA